ncbi:glutathione binding-like protein [Roseibium sp.]|uniref:glutathione binding-like protein n=1 Tax=Roseibium sp. TaxID=1936156 RepID=UPI003D0BE335
MKLFYKSGACSMAAHILLNEADVPYTLEKVDTDAGTTESGIAYSKINPRGYVPALKLDDGAVLTENVAILTWLSEQFPQLGPQGGTSALQKYRMLEAVSFLTSELHKAFSPYFSGKTFSAHERAGHLAVLKKKISQFEAMLPDSKGYLLGETFSVADAYAFVILNWTNFIGVSLTEWPRITDYVNQIKARPATRRTLQEEGLAA